MHNYCKVKLLALGLRVSFFVFCVRGEVLRGVIWVVCSQKIGCG